MSAEQHQRMMMPIGYPVDHFGPVKRRPVNEVAYADRWATAWPG